MISRGGGVADIFCTKIISLSTGEKNKMLNEIKNKKVRSSFSLYFKAQFPVSYKDLQITQKLTCIKYVDLH